MDNDVRHIRLELDDRTHEIHRYFAQLRGRSLGWHLRRVLALYAETAEKENPPIRAHMLAWHAARTQGSTDTGSPDLDEIPY